MAEIHRIADQLTRSYKGIAWHGPSLMELLDGLGAEDASRRPIPGAHSIWEIVLHIKAWEEVTRHRIHGQALPDLPPADDWPAVDQPSPDRWKETLAGLERSTLELGREILQLEDTRLKEIIPTKEYSIYFMLHGVIQHNLYHAGQIALLKRAIGSAERSGE